MTQPPMNAQTVQRYMLDRGWTLDDLQEAQNLLEYLERDADCREAIEAYDRLRQLMSREGGQAASVASPSLGRAVMADESEPDASQPVEGWHAFDDRFSAHARRVTHESRTWLMPMLRIAAVLAIVAGAGFVGYLVGGGAVMNGADATASGSSQFNFSPIGRSTPADTASLLPQDVQAQVAVFGEVSSVFEHQAGWVAFADGRSDMGMASGRVAKDDRLLLVRLSLARDGELISQADVVIVPGQKAQLTLPLEGDRVLRYHLHVSDESAARVGLWAEMLGSAGGGETLAAIKTRLRFEPGQAVAAGALTTEAGDYTLTTGFRQVDRTVSDPAMEYKEGL